MSLLYSVDPASVPQLIFSMIRWLSMLYTPSLSLRRPGTENLTIDLKDGAGTLLKSEVYRRLSVNLADDQAAQVHLPLHHLFPQFGELIPEKCRPPASSLHQVDVFQEQLVVSYLNFQTLYEVAGIRIFWVDCLSLHLDYDEKNNRLKVFRFPSFCKLLCTNMLLQFQTNTPESPKFLSSLFETIREPQTHADTSIQNSNALEFYREVLLSYRLIFGQDKRSRKAWRKYCATDVAAFPAATADPLLPILCSSDSALESTYSDIDAPGITQQYPKAQYFPYFGERLVKIQASVLKKNPSDWKTLWNDRRDLLRWYTFWAVVIVGGASLFLSLMQNIEGAIQAAYSAKSSN